MSDNIAVDSIPGEIISVRQVQVGRASSSSSSSSFSDKNDNRKIRSERKGKKQSTKTTTTTTTTFWEQFMMSPYISQSSSSLKKSYNRDKKIDDDDEKKNIIADNNIECNNDIENQEQQQQQDNYDENISDYDNNAVNNEEEGNAKSNRDNEEDEGDDDIDNFEDDDSDDDDVEEEEIYLRIALGRRSMHLPGNGDKSWWVDWKQFVCNTHPVLGLCFHHRLHPIRKCERFIALIGSIAFGILVTNMIYLYFLWSTDDTTIVEETLSIFSSSSEDDDEVTASAITANATANAIINAAVGTSSADNNDGTTAEFWKKTALEIFSGRHLDLIILCLLGSIIHTMFDLSMWFLLSCFCCIGGIGNGILNCGRLKKDKNGSRWQRTGNFIVLFFVVIIMASASLVVVIRASGYQLSHIQDVAKQGFTYALINAEDNNNIDDEDSNNTTSPLDYQTMRYDDDEQGELSFEFDDYKFLFWWLATELVFALFVAYFVVNGIIFSGVLGCNGRIPVFGGRRFQMKMENKRQKRRRRRKEKKKKMKNKRKRQRQDNERIMLSSSSSSLLYAKMTKSTSDEASFTNP